MKNKYFKIGLTIAGVLIVAVLGSIFVNLPILTCVRFVGYNIFV
jgi:hypothetical protein